MVKHKANIMRAAMIVIVLQFFALFMPFVINWDKIQFTWLGMPPEVSFWVFFLIATIAFLIMAFYVGEHDKENEDG